jgi:hypothetical protein
MTIRDAVFPLLVAVFYVGAWTGAASADVDAGTFDSFYIFLAFALPVTLGFFAGRKWDEV